MGPIDRHHRQQRKLRNHPHVRQRVRPTGRQTWRHYPDPLRGEIDALNSRLYDTVNNGVYRAGFATTQEAYAEAIGPLFDTLNWLDDRLATRRFLTGNGLSEADIRLFTTLLRFDAVYVGHFKCNLRRIVDYPNLLQI